MCQFNPKLPLQPSARAAATGRVSTSTRPLVAHGREPINNTSTKLTSTADAPRSFFQNTLVPEVADNHRNPSGGATPAVSSYWTLCQSRSWLTADRLYTATSTVRNRIIYFEVPGTSLACTRRSSCTSLNRRFCNRLEIFQI